MIIEIDMKTEVYPNIDLLINKINELVDIVNQLSKDGKPKDDEIQGCPFCGNKPIITETLSSYHIK